MSRKGHDIFGFDIPIHHLEQTSQPAKRASAFYAQAFQRLQGLVVSRECVGTVCAFFYVLKIIYHYEKKEYSFNNQEQVFWLG